MIPYICSITLNDLLCNVFTAWKSCFETSLPSHFFATGSNNAMSQFRTDIQALRAVAVLLVLGFHVWPTHIAGGYVGVDVFFVISGYLITGHLVREVVATGRVDLPTFYARRARRLLPAASLTLVSVGVAAYMWMPAATWATTASDIAASTMYAQNWVLVRRSVDYYAQDQAPSPLQHFWSLAVEEQFYLGWPVLVAGVAAWWKRRARQDSKGGSSNGASSPSSQLQSAPPARVYALVMGIPCILSLGAAVYYAGANPAAGYFMTHTRLYELGLGGLLAVWAEGRSEPHAGLKPVSKALMPATRASHWCRSLAAATGLAAIGISSCLYSSHLAFPGCAALLPVCGAVWVLVAGERLGVEDCTATHALAPALGHPWLQYIGDISYSLYLAHWPVVVVYPFMTGRDIDDSFPDGVTVLAVSWVLAHACKRGWEDKWRTTVQDKSGPDNKRGIPAFCGTHTAKAVRTDFNEAVHMPRNELFSFLSSQRRSPLTGAVLMTILMVCATLCASITLHMHTPPRVDEALLLPEPGMELNATTAARTNTASKFETPGCDAFFGSNASHPYPGADALLHKCRVLNSLPISEALSLTELGSRTGRVNSKPHPNALGSDPGRPPSPLGRIVLMGDSHARDWGRTFELVANRLGFNFTGFPKASCPPTLTLLRGGAGPKTDCQEWIANTTDWILRERPAVVALTSSSRFRSWLENTSVADGVVQVAKKLVAADIPVLAIKSTPVMPEHVPNCLAKEVKRHPTGTNLSSCSVTRENGLEMGPVDTAASVYPMIRLLSFDDLFCVDKTCPPVIGNVVVYRDNNHLTYAFSRSLAPALEQKLLEAAPHLDGGRIRREQHADGKSI